MQPTPTNITRTSSLDAVQHNIVYNWFSNCQISLGKERRKTSPHFILLRVYHNDMKPAGTICIYRGFGLSVFLLATLCSYYSFTSASVLLYRYRAAALSSKLFKGFHSFLGNYPDSSFYTLQGSKSSLMNRKFDVGIQPYELSSYYVAIVSGAYPRQLSCYQIILHKKRKSIDKCYTK